MKADDPRLISAVVEGLRESGQLRAFRPTMLEFKMSGQSGWYVHESDIDATPVYVPLTDLYESLPVPKALNVWVSDPRWYAEREPDERDSYLIMAQELNFDINERPSHISGWSALKVLAKRLGKGYDLDIRLDGIQQKRYPSTHYNPEPPINSLRTSVVQYNYVRKLRPSIRSPM